MKYALGLWGRDELWNGWVCKTQAYAVAAWPLVDRCKITPCTAIHNQPFADQYKFQLPLEMLR